MSQPSGTSRKKCIFITKTMISFLVCIYISYGISGFGMRIWGFQILKSSNPQILKSSNPLTMRSAGKIYIIQINIVSMPTTLKLFFWHKELRETYICVLTPDTEARTYFLKCLYSSDDIPMYEDLRIWGVWNEDLRISNPQILTSKKKWQSVEEIRYGGQKKKSTDTECQDDQTITRQICKTRQARGRN